uniref:Putative cytochrome P450 n=1 Tax=Puccinia horiana TaxID=331382 RepID=W8FKX7_9BASI|nr:putative cytochrome P450 [Puccinia horiana]
MTSEYVSKGLRLTFMPYHDLWRRQRKLLHLLTQPKAATSYQPIQSQESAQLCLDILNNPSEHWKHSQRYAGSTVLQIAFNRRALDITDPAITKMREVNQKMVQTAVPGRYLIDSIPILRHLPQFLSPWKQYGNQLFNETLDLFGELYRKVSQHPHPSSSTCFVARIESLKKSYQLTDDQAIFLAGAMFGAGSDTTADAIETFIFACAANPDKVAKAQEELDRVVGRERLPEFSDEEALGLAHMTTEDDEYEGYFIPKGTAIVANHWSIHLDEATYKEPEKFIPERFIDPHTGSLIGTRWSVYGHHAFGFGRRICPGLYIANKFNSLQED